MINKTNAIRQRAAMLNGIILPIAFAKRIGMGMRFAFIAFFARCHAGGNGKQKDNFFHGFNGLSMPSNNKY